MENTMFWANVTSYIDRLIRVEYDPAYAVKAASLKYHVTEADILKHSEIEKNTSIGNCLYED